MKRLPIFCIICIFACCLISCGGNTTTPEATPTAKTDSHAGHDHAGHDHSGHDHAGHNHAGHDHAGHNHSTKSSNLKQTLSPEEKAQKKKEFDAAMAKPLTQEEKQTADNICQCMKNIKLFNKVVGASNQAAFDQAAGDNFPLVKALQNCHNTMMPRAIKNKGEQGAIFAYRSRGIIDKECLKGNSNLWLLIGKYIATHSSEASKVSREIGEKKAKFQNPKKKIGQ